MIIQNGGIDAVEKWIEDEKKRSEKLKELVTAENKETIVKVLEIVYDRVMECEGTLITESGDTVANVIDGQDAMDAICYTIEEVKNIEPREKEMKLIIDMGKVDFTAEELVKEIIENEKNRQFLNEMNMERERNSIWLIDKRRF